MQQNNEAVSFALDQVTRCRLFAQVGSNHSLHDSLVFPLDDKPLEGTFSENHRPQLRYLDRFPRLVT